MNVCAKFAVKVTFVAANGILMNRLRASVVMVNLSSCAASTTAMSA